MTPRQTPTAALMRAAQDVPDRPRVKIQIGIDASVILAVDARCAKMVPKMKRNEAFRAAVRMWLEETNNGGNK